MRKHSVIVLLISLIAAFIFWLYVVTTIAPDTTGSINGVYIDVSGDAVLEANGLMITEFSTREIRVELETSRAILSKLNSNNVTAVIDVSRITEPGEYSMSYTIKFPETVNPGEISILGKSKDEITIRVEQIAMNKLTIEPIPLNQQEEGCIYDDASVEFEPGTVTLKGPENEVNNVARAVVYFDLSGLDDTLIFDGELVYLDADDNEVELSANTTASVSEVHTTVPILWRKAVNLAVNIIYGAGISEENVEVTLSTDSTLVSGSKAAITELGDTLIIGDVDLTKVKNGDELQFTIDLDSVNTGLTNISATNVTAKVRFVGLEDKTYEVADVVLENIPESMKVDGDYDMQTVDVTLRGNPEILQGINQEDIHVVVDLSKVSQTGERTFEATVRIDGNPNVTVVGKVIVYVKLISAE